MSGPRFIMAAGGTGGHLWPALSLARALKEARPESEFLFVGTGRPLEETILGPEGVARAVIKTSGVKGLGLAGKIKGLWGCAGGFFAARRLVASFRPTACLALGGYVTVPVALAAKAAGVPVALHEQNSRPGLSNRFLARFADRVMVAFGEAAASFPPAKTVVTGNPVRPEIEALHGLERDFGAEAPLIAVTGGSQGASALNAVASRAMVLLAQGGARFTVTHQTGERDCGAVGRLYAESGVAGRAVPFVRDMAALYGGASLLIGRAGAITVAEAAASRLPSILVPLPTAADDHQTVNAASLAGRGAALALAQKGLTPEALAAAVGDLLAHREKLAAMSQAAGAAARIGAARAMAAAVLELL